MFSNYGSYALSPRLARPTRLQLMAEEAGDGTLVTLQLTSIVWRPFDFFWEQSQRIFWSRFPRWTKKEPPA